MIAQGDKMQVGNHTPRRIVPPITVLLPSGMKITTFFFPSLPTNSSEFASFHPRMDLQYSMTATCIPKQMPRNGFFFSLANVHALTLPSTPLPPNPPGHRMPSEAFRPGQKKGSVYKSASIYGCGACIIAAKHLHFPCSELMHLLVHILAENMHPFSQ